MASFKKLKSGKWQAQVARDGVRKAKSFFTKREAQDWASKEESAILRGENSIKSQYTFEDALLRYVRDESPKKRGKAWEVKKANFFINNFDISKKRLCDLTSADFAHWRDERLRSVKGSTVKREMVFLSSVLKIAVNEWGWITESPLKQVKKPRDEPHRNRLVYQSEIDALLTAAGVDLSKPRARAMHAFLFAIETAMRAGEIINLLRKNVDFEKRVAFLPLTKNGSAREVPLSKKAIELLEILPENGESFFNLNSAQLDALFRKSRDKAGIQNLHFHDSRHEAITRLSKKLNPLELARVVGHKDLKMLMVYYNESAEDLAKKL